MKSGDARVEPVLAFALKVLRWSRATSGSHLTGARAGHVSAINVATGLSISSSTSKAVSTSSLSFFFGTTSSSNFEGSRGFSQIERGVRGHGGALWVASTFRADMKRILVVCSN